MAKRPIPRTPLYSTARSVAYRSIPAPASSSPTERVVNGNFSSATGWTQGAGWVIAGGVATGTLAEGNLDNALSSPIAVGAALTWAVTITVNAASDSILIQMVNSGSGLTQDLDIVADAGAFGGVDTASVDGPFDVLRFVDIQFSGTVVMDNASLIA